MKILFHRLFKKQYRKQSPKRQKKIDEALFLFEQNPFAAQLKNHALSGEYSGKRSISVGGDFRLIFEEFDGRTVMMFLCMGTHSQLY